MNKLLKIFTYPICQEVEQAVKHEVRNTNAAPECCRLPMEYIGEHSDFHSNTQFYQCSKCKTVKILHLADWRK